MKAIFLALTLVFLGATMVKAQKSDCLSDFDFLVEKIRKD